MGIQLPLGQASRLVGLRWREEHTSRNVRFGENIYCRNLTNIDCLCSREKMPFAAAARIARDRRPTATCAAVDARSRRPKLERSVIVAIIRVQVYRGWHRRINVRVKRMTVLSALDANGVSALVMARGHIIDGIDEVRSID